MKLTVIFRNDGPLIFCNDTPSYRTVQIELYDPQVRMLEPRHIGINCGKDVYESISRCYFEPENASQEDKEPPAPQPQGEICSNEICAYCVHYDGKGCGGRHCEYEYQGFEGRKLSPVQ